MTQIAVAPWPVYADDEREAVDRVLASGKSNYWSGNEAKLFEQEFADWCGTDYGLCVFNGTVALEISLKASGILPGDEVIVTPRSFLASAASVAAIGATPVFADIDMDSGNLTAETIAEAITEKTRGVVVVHLGGWPSDIPPIMELARRHNIRVIEDCAQAHGATVHGQRVGSFGDVSAFSFCQDKIISTGGEGGMILTNDVHIRDAAWSLRDHGRNREQTLSSEHSLGFRWTQDRIGTNGRMTEMQAVIGRCQLQKIDNWIHERTTNAQAITDGLQELRGINVPIVPKHMTHAFYRLTALVDEEQKRNGIVDQLRSLGVSATVGPCPEIYREAPFVDEHFAPETPLPVAVGLGKQSIVLPVHPGMQSSVGSIIDQFMSYFD